MSKKLIKEVQAPEKTAVIYEKPKDRENKYKKTKRQIKVKSQKKPLDFDYIEELKTQLTYGDTGHGILLDKKI